MDEGKQAPTITINKTKPKPIPMASKEMSYVFLSFAIIVVGVAASTVDSHLPIDSVRRSSFPKGFVFGTASSAYQYEGAASEDGKGPSIWDTFTHLKAVTTEDSLITYVSPLSQPHFKNRRALLPSLTRHPHQDKIVDCSNGDVALDSYHRYKEDVALMKTLGFEAYRFSIAWSRILPKGKLSGGVNKKGIDYYNNLINELLANGIEPYVTLFHWDVPQALEDEYKGFLDYQIVNDFQDYAEVCFKEFGDRVKYWITLNEPWSFVNKGYVTGQFAPGRCSDWQQVGCLGGDSGTEPYIAMHHQILAHAVAVNLYKTKYQIDQKGVIGVTLLTFWYTPYSNSEADKRAASRALDFALGWFLDPITYGDYPPIMRALVNERLPKFTKEQTLLIKGSYDFLGMNYYTANFAKDNPNAPGPKPSYMTDIRADLTTDRDGVSIGPKVNASSWLAIYPQGFKDLLIYTKNKYNDPIMYITENGYLDYDDFPTKNLIEDEGRVKYYHDHLASLLEAIKAGARVKGYFAWSLLDNFEWADGYSVRFGLTYVDYQNNLKKTLKNSGKWFQNHFLST